MVMNMGFTLEGGLQGNTLALTCTGVVRDYDAYKAFKAVLFELAGTNEIDHLKKKAFEVLEVKFVDAYPLPDSLVGFFLKLSERDSVSVNLTTNENKMLSFFISIFLDEKFNVRLFL